MWKNVYLRSAIKIKKAFFLLYCSRLFVSLSWHSKVLTLGKLQIYLHFRSLNRTFAHDLASNSTMAKNNAWQDDYWLPLMQLYLKRPVGEKPMYAREAIDLCMELHIAPQALAQRMKQIATLSTPRIERIWQTYAENPRRLARAVRLWREMRGFGDASSFYEGVDVTEGFERDFRPLEEDARLTPVMLILILDLYFRLTPITMVASTPEVQELARLMKVEATLVVEVLNTFQACDPYLNRNEAESNKLLTPCKQVWQRYGNGEIEQLAAFAEELKNYFRTL